MFRIAADACSPAGNQGFDPADRVGAGHGEVTINVL
jgi:hypothetical protein